MWPHIFKIPVSIWFTATFPCVYKRKLQTSNGFYIVWVIGALYIWNIRCCFKAAVDIAAVNNSSIWEYFHSVPKLYLRGEGKWWKRAPRGCQQVSQWVMITKLFQKRWLGVGGKGGEGDRKTNFGRTKFRRKTILSLNLASALCHRKL